MILKALKYTRFAGEAREWRVVGKEDAENNSFAYFENINLLVGKNSSGKSRTLDVIREIADLFAQRVSLKRSAYPTEKFELIFEDKSIQYEYLLDYKDRVIINESLKADDIILLDRKEGVLLSPKNKVKLNLDFRDEELAICLLDANNHPIFDAFVQWGKSLKNFMFSNQHEKLNLVKSYEGIEVDDQNVENIVVHTFHKGRTEYGKAFVSEIKNSMKELGYLISDIDIQETKKGYGLSIEEDHKYIVSQREMSQGMFRALSLFVQLTYMRLSQQSICILLDDMGEGLDYDRSKGLIEILINKLKQSNIQLFMTSNDRYVMNRVPLKYWSVIDREGCQSVFYNYENSKGIFEDFRYTGLNNFDFLTTDFYSKGFGDIEE